MDKVPFSHVDVFSSTPFGGNPLPVFFDTWDLTTEDMLNITRELRQFEAVFLGPVVNDIVPTRIFDLLGELPFAGHPLLGAAAALQANTASSHARTWTFDLSGRRVAVEVETLKGYYFCTMEQGSIHLEDSIVNPSDWPAQFDLSSNDLHPCLPLQVGSTGLRYLIVPVTSDALPRAHIKQDISSSLAKVGADYAVLFDPERLEIRHWNNDGLTEDIATGSAAGVVAGYCVRHGLKEGGSPIPLSQGRFVRRTSRILATCQGDSTSLGEVKVGGDVVVVGHGCFNIRGLTTAPSKRPYFIDSATLQRTIRLEHLLSSMDRAFRESSSDNAQNGFFTIAPGERRSDGDVHVKAGALHGNSIFLVKVSPWFAINVARGVPQGGFIAVLNSRTGNTIAYIEDEHYLSDIRTAAAGAIVARELAPKMVKVAAVLGSGVQAYWQCIALYQQRPYETLLVYARDPEKAGALASRLRQELLEVQCEVVAGAYEAVREAQVIITATSSAEPILRGAWLRPGQHITAIGADDPYKCELDSAALHRARVFVDERQSALANGDLLRAISLKEYDGRHLAGEIGDVLLGRVEGRQNEEQITLAKLVGIGAQDLVACEEAIRRIDQSLLPAQ